LNSKGVGNAPASGVFPAAGYPVATGDAASASPQAAHDETPREQWQRRFAPVEWLLVGRKPKVD
jgi:hypothetical protein